MTSAMICEAYGEPESLKLGELPLAAMKPDSVRITVHAAGVNFPDILSVQGRYQFRYPFPFAPGMEVSGVVVEVGEAVTRVGPGDRVIAHPWVNGYAEEAVADEAAVFPLPDGLDLTAAAGVPVTYGTVAHALFDRAQLRAGESLLVLGAAGGVGLNAVELGCELGARVIAAAGSAEKLALTHAYGAAATVNYREQDLRRAVRELTDGAGVDVVFDAVGGDATRRAVHCLAWAGRLLIIGFAGGEIARIPAGHLLIKCREAVGVAYHTHTLHDPEGARRNMATVLDWWAAGRLSPHISMTFPLAEAAQAMTAIRERRSTGKVVLTVR